MCLERAIEPGLIDAYLAELAELKASSPSPLSVTSFSPPDPVPYSPEILANHISMRTEDDYFFAHNARPVLFHPRIVSFLTAAFDGQPMLTQSLNFEEGSAQAVHQDTAFVTMTSPLKFAGVWIALEDVQPGSGELVLLPW